MSIITDRYSLSIEPSVWYRLPQLRHFRKLGSRSYKCGMWLDAQRMFAIIAFLWWCHSMSAWFLPCISTFSFQVLIKSPNAESTVFLVHASRHSLIFFLRIQQFLKQQSSKGALLLCRGRTSGTWIKSAYSSIRETWTPKNDIASADVSTAALWMGRVERGVELDRDNVAGISAISCSEGVQNWISDIIRGEGEFCLQSISKSSSEFPGMEPWFPGIFASRRAFLSAVFRLRGCDI